MKDAYYFSHDSNAASDPNIVYMRLTYGWEGYGLYWAIVEHLRDIPDYTYQIKRIDALAYDLHYDNLDAFVTDCIEKFDLFISDGERFWSKSLCRRMEALANERQRRSEAGAKAAHSRWNATALQPQCDSMPVKESKVEQSKEKEKVMTTSPAGVGDEDPILRPEQVPDRYKIAADVVSSEFGMDLRVSHIDILDDIFKTNYPSTVYAQLRKVRKRSDETGKKPPDDPVSYIHSYMRGWTKKGGKKETEDHTGASWTCSCGKVNVHSGGYCLACKKDKPSKNTRSET